MHALHLYLHYIILSLDPPDDCPEKNGTLVFYTALTLVSLSTVLVKIVAPETHFCITLYRSTSSQQ